MGKSYQQKDLTVGVTYYGNRATSVKKCCGDYEKMLDKYIRLLEMTHSEGIVTGETADLFDDFITQVKSAKQLITNIGNDYSNSINAFLQDMDTADDKLFKNKGRKILTDKEFNNAMMAANIEFSIPTFFSWIWEQVFKFAQKQLGISLADDLNKSHSSLYKKVNELNEYTKRELREIQAACKAVDKRYSVQLRNVFDELKKYNKIIQKISSIMNPYSNNLTKENIADLKKYIDRLKKQHKEHVKNPEKEVVADSDVKYFADTIDDYFGKTTNSIKIICERSLSQIFVTDFDRYRSTVNAAREYFNSFSKNYTQSKEKFDKAKAEFDEMLKRYNQYGSNFAQEYMEPEKAKLFNKIMKKFAGYSGDANDYFDIWYQMYFDMSESKNALERFKSNCDLSNSNVKKAIERLEELYDKNIDAYVAETYETFLSQAKNKGIKAAAKAVNEFLKKKNKIIGTISEKLFDYAYKDVKAVAMYDWVEATGTSFEHAIQKLRKVDKNAKNYKELVKTVREAFAAAKKARLEFFKEMIKNEKDGVLKGYYQYAYNTIENASLSDEDSLAFMSLDDYTGVNYNPLTD